MTARRLSPLVVLTVLLALGVHASCTRAEDKAAKARIFSPEEPTGAQAEALNKLDADRLADDGQLAKRVLRMTRAEIGHRLQSYKARTEVAFSWTRGPLPTDAGGPEIALTQESSMTLAKSGDFFVHHTNSKSAGWELVRAQGSVYVRSLPGPFRKRRTDRSDADDAAEKAFLSLSTFDRLARGLKLRLEGQTTAGGHRALRYAVAGSGARLGPEDERELPPIQYPEPPAGMAGKALYADPDTARRMELFEKEQVVSVSGTLTVDADTAAPLAANLEGKFRVVGKPDQPPAELTLSVTLATTEIGAPLEVKVPNFEPDPSTPHAVKDPLRFLGKTGPAGAPSTAEPVDDNDEPDTDPSPEAPEKPAATPAPTPKTPAVKK